MYAVNYLSVKITQVSNIQNVKDTSVSSKELSTKTRRLYPSIQGYEPENLSYISIYLDEDKWTYIYI